MSRDAWTDRLDAYYPADIRRQAIARARQHVDADMLRQGAYWTDDEQRGCWIGCHAHDLGLPVGDHAALARAYRLPEWLLHLADAAHEGLPADAIAGWHVRLLEAIPAGMGHDAMDVLRRRHLVRCLDLAAARVTEDEGGVLAAVAEVRGLLVESGTDQEWAAAWTAAETAAGTARAAALAAALAAAGTAAWAARAAAQAAAGTAAETAAWTARAAARAAAEAAAEAAVWVTLTDALLYDLEAVGRGEVLHVA